MSRRLYACVVAQRKLWRLRFERDFSRQDENEQRWLRLYARTHLAGLLFAEKQQEVLQADELLDWFRVYCNRRATESRWRHGLYTVRQLKQTTSMHQPVWIAEQLCWDGVDADSTLTTGFQRSDDYLIVAVEPPSMDMPFEPTNATLYVWHLNALHLPPRPIMSRFADPISLYRNWLVARKRFMNNSVPGITLVFDLAKHTARPGVIEREANSLHIQQATKDSIHLLWRDEIGARTSHVMISWRFWDFTPNRAPPTQCLTVCKVQFHANNSYLKTCRIGDSRFIMLNRNSWSHSTDIMPPTIALVEITESNTGITMKEKWSLAQELDDITPIVSQSMLLMTRRYNSRRLLSLDDGSLVQDISIATLDCWSKSGLYPLRSQWMSMSEDITWNYPADDSKISSISGGRWSASSNALLETGSENSVVVDYAV
ncbi:hypothetical protein THASP1DRAFT_29253 [Thamnocephalis sphaerospora]|uniref:Uncharacterized protein n=1 Tax=Thamnocephalis sphaerospora TaxID=78915 RepID=A0A4P9XS71_9FUNG|nr:hypothetical protein THASP1DRAFT_29253 [Thamnocephalis sphaerospora]|eukprot:RKP08956.1 hypothetical protein THASP1DRAFT_29253 [Thamnocephalis sphaerospora]